MLFNSHGILFPKEIENIYEKYINTVNQTGAFCYNWENGRLGCFLSIICVTNEDKTKTLITTRNNDSIRKSRNPKSKKHYEIITPTYYDIEHIEVVPANMSMYDYLMKYHSEYAETIEITDDNKYLLDNRDVNDSYVWTTHLDGKEITYLLLHHELLPMWKEFYEFYKRNFIDKRYISTFDFSNVHKHFYQMLKDNSLYDLYTAFNDAYLYRLTASLDSARTNFCDGCILIGKKGCLGRKQYKQTGKTGFTSCTKYINKEQYKIQKHYDKIKDIPYKYLCIYTDIENENNLSLSSVIMEKTDIDLINVINQLALHEKFSVDKNFMKTVKIFYNDETISSYTFSFNDINKKLTFYKF